MLSGVLFRKDKEGTPRYASEEYLGKLMAVKNSEDGANMRLAGHLCGKSVNDVLSGDPEFKYLCSGFGRVRSAQQQ